MEIDKALETLNNPMHKTHSFFRFYCLGLLCYISGRYDDSLQHFQQLLETYVGVCPPNVYLGIGLCALKLNEMEIASIAFSRAKFLVLYVFVCL